MLPTVVAALLIAAIQVVQVTGKVLDKQLTKFCAPCEKPCGIVPVKGTFSVKIVGGENSGENEFGWIATLACNNMFMCGCIVITKKHVLTAAHCVESILTPDILKVTAGEYDQSVKTGHESYLKVASIHVHPDYQNNTKDNDIAILELCEAVSIVDNPWVRVACLPKSAETLYDDINGTVIGWGKLGESENDSKILKKVDVPIMSNAECKEMGYLPQMITDNMICAGYKEGKQDSCQGDSGGPLHRRVNSSNVMEVIGIVSWGSGCARQNFPGVYTRVANYLEWIMTIIGDECICGTESS